MSHDLANLLSIALANVEAMIDGALEPTPERLENVRKALCDARALMLAQSSTDAGEKS
ncbi:MAG: hypothetical protein JO029_06295 [Candidatus Eremiobacteraeota bacterium]|nr:hypothetical protein [Candidatus Eremiobacteraeota bacterium]MBV8433874.1 hypothetical protein [Candidatus Eremiobacteraeota bacterium]MBV8584442.1 hypothetical protein [Candidatus Eremiobacteraeota bacterium]MBV8654896.1 hypothetical protein [Candidatus Eremiobacteraeota bacterium]MBV8722732.1 hypothetical protein [Candidatus Eremiobacteraeota bacterium]